MSIHTLPLATIMSGDVSSKMSENDEKADENVVEK
jgi:hypothetical protein